MSHASASNVELSREGRIGRILLNRPRALNALDRGMVREIAAGLHQWRDDPAIHAIVIEGAGGKAFCAGGDIRAIRQLSVEGRHDEVEAFFADEYALNQMIADYPKPYVALVDGICMGGGIGVSVHGSARIVSEAAMFAMPEAAIALFPDIGATYILPRLRGHVGMYMALTGARLHGADAAYVGLATHFTDRETLAALPAALATHGTAAWAGATRPFDAPIAKEMAAIDRCFGADSVAAILYRLENEGGDWASRTLSTLRSMSPSAVLWTFRIVHAGATRTLPQCLAAELALTRHATRHPDFAEGVRAMVIDKDRQPKWTAMSIEAVDPAAIDAMF